MELFFIATLLKKILKTINKDGEKDRRILTGMKGIKGMAENQHNIFNHS